MATISPGSTNNPTQGLRYRVVISVPRVLDSAFTELCTGNAVIPTGTVPASAVTPFTMSTSRSFPRDTRMENTVVTPMPDCPNYSRVQSNVIIPMQLDMTDVNGLTFQTNTNFTHPLDIVMFVPTDASFPYEIISEGVTDTSTGTGDRDSTTVTQLGAKIITRVNANTDLLIPSYGFAPLNPARLYENRFCDDFMRQPLFPPGKASPVSR